MAVDTPELERITVENRARVCSVPSRLDILAEEEHNARIKDRYRRLINPENKIEDVFGRQEAPVAYEQLTVAPAMQTPAQYESVSSSIYRVENARADSVIFRADSLVNNKGAELSVAQPDVDVAPVEEESEDLRPTPTTIQYQTVGAENEQQKVSFASDSKGRVFGKREKIIVAVFVAVVVALLVLVVVNASIIANLNTEIAHVQDSITTVRGALAGVNSTVEEVIRNTVGH